MSKNSAKTGYAAAAEMILAASHREMKTEKTEAKYLDIEDLKASLAAIHYHASRPSVADKIGMLAQMAFIADECERHLPELRKLRPTT